MPRNIHLVAVPSGSEVQSEPEFLVIQVRDNGIGLSAEGMKAIFGMFSRVQSAAAREEGGLGIGLALAKGFTELHGGRLRVHSAGPDKGSEFFVCLPRSVIVNMPQSSAPEPGGATDVVAPRRVMIADDNHDIADSVGMLLQLAGHEVHLAYNGEEALALAERVRPEFGILDVGMPDLTGYEVAERLRRQSWAKNLVLIALTGWGQAEDKRLAASAGFNHHLTKPVAPEVLEELLRG